MTSRLNVLERLALAIILADISGICLDDAVRSHIGAEVISYIQYSVAVLLALGVLAAPYIVRNRNQPHD